MGDSGYLFDGSKSELHTGCFIALIIFGFGLYQFYRIAKGSTYLVEGEKRRLPIATLLTGMGLAIFIITISNASKLERIKNFRAETVGTTVAKIRQGKSFVIKYRFLTKNGVFYGYSNGVKVNVEDVKIPEGYYKVIYNYKNPLESVMDFQIKEDEKASGDTSSNY